MSEIHLPKPSGWKWYNGERGTWWYKETRYGVRTGCPCCGLRALGYPVEIRHGEGCPRHPGLREAVR